MVTLYPEEAFFVVENTAKDAVKAAARINPLLAVAVFGVSAGVCYVATRPRVKNAIKRVLTKTQAESV